jgi:peptidoglycan hydrolase CwlO-like protein
MTKLRKIWSFLKTHWYIPLALIGAILLLFVSRGNSKALMEIIRRSRDTHKKEVEKLDEIQAEEIQKRDLAIKRFHSTIAEVEKKFEESNQSLDRKKKKEIKKIVEEVGDNPEELTKRISALTGFGIVLPED